MAINCKLERKLVTRRITQLLMDIFGPPLFVPTKFRSGRRWSLRIEAETGRPCWKHTRLGLAWVPYGLGGPFCLDFLNWMTVPGLKTLCEIRGLYRSGTRDELITRLEGEPFREMRRWRLERLCRLAGIAHENLIKDTLIHNLEDKLKKCHAIDYEENFDRKCAFQLINRFNYELPVNMSILRRQPDYLFVTQKQRDERKRQESIERMCDEEDDDIESESELESETESESSESPWFSDDESSYGEENIPSDVQAFLRKNPVAGGYVRVKVNGVIDWEDWLPYLCKCPPNRYKAAYKLCQEFVD